MKDLGATRLGNPATEELVREMKAAAIHAGLTYSEFIVEAVQEKLGRVPKQEPVVNKAVVVEEEIPEYLASCLHCGKRKIVVWGPTQVHCADCGRNFPKEMYGIS